MLFVYFDLCGRKQLKKTKGEGVPAVTVNLFSKWAFKIPDTVSHAKDAMQSTWIVPAPGCSIRYINTCRYRAGHKSTNMLRRVHREQHYLSFV